MRGSCPTRRSGESENDYAGMVIPGFFGLSCIVIRRADTKYEPTIAELMLRFIDTKHQEQSLSTDQT